MTTKIKYPVGTIGQMADIPADALPRFLAELPDMLETIREARASSLTLAGATPLPWWLRWASDDAKLRAIRSSMRSCTGATWIDDDLGLATVSIRTTPNGETLFSETRPAPSRRR